MARRGERRGATGEGAAHRVALDGAVARAKPQGAERALRLVEAELERWSWSRAARWSRSVGVVERRPGRPR